MAVRESIIKGNKQNSPANMPQNIKQDNLNNENQSLVFEKDRSSFNEPILANDSSFTAKQLTRMHPNHLFGF